MPPNTVSVCRPGKWGNPYKVGSREFVAGGPHRTYTAATAVEAFECWLKHDYAAASLRRELSELRGKNLACFCPLDQPCHADVLLSQANAKHTGEAP